MIMKDTEVETHSTPTTPSTTRFSPVIVPVLSKQQISTRPANGILKGSVQKMAVSQAKDNLNQLSCFLEKEERDDGTDSISIERREMHSQRAIIPLATREEQQK